MLRSPQAGCSARSGKGSMIRLRAVVRSQSRCRAPCLQDADSSGQPSFLRSPPESSCPTPFVAGEGAPSVKHSDGLHAGSCRR